MLRDPRAQILEAFAGLRRDLKRRGIAVLQAPSRRLLHGVDLVEDELSWELVGSDLVEDGVDRRHLLDEPRLRARCIDDVEHEVGDERLLERRREPLDELGREAADEPDGVGHEITAPFVLEATRRWVERLEEAVTDGDARVGERVEKCRLAGVRVTGERDRRRLTAAAFLPADVALAAQAPEPFAELGDAAASETAVALELRFAGAARADAGPEPTGAAAETFEVLPHATHARQVVFELRKLDLKLALGTDGMLGEDVEDELRAVDDARLQRVLECALLRGAQFVVDEQHLGLGLPVRLLQLLELSPPDEGARVGARPVLDDLRHRFDARGTRELLQLGDLVGRVGSGGKHGEDEPALGLGRHRAIGLFHRHLAVIMTRTVPFPDLAARTLELIDTPSESRHEGAAMELVRSLLPGRTLYDDGEAIVWGEPAAPVVLAGHVDTVPAQGNIPGRIEGDAVHGLGASDMKGGVAVMLELARAGYAARYVFFTREEVPLEESPLPGVFKSGVLGGVDLAVVLEPTDCILHAGCLGNLQARVEFHGESAHSARPWTGLNAIDALVEGLGPIAGLAPLDVELDGLVYREVLSIVRVAGGIAQNVVPAEAAAELNFRFAPGRSRDEAEARLRELVTAGNISVLHNSPAALPGLANPHAARLRELVPDVAPKQAWTPVAQFAEQGIDAINYGPGATAYAHKVDEQIPVANLHTAYDTLARFLS